MDIFVGDNPVRLRLHLGDDYDVGSDPVAIRCLKPDGTDVVFTAVKQAANIIYYDAGPADLNVAGPWHLQSVHDPADAPIHHGKTVVMYVKALGT